MKDQQADIVRLNHFIRDFSVSSVYCYSKTQKKKKDKHLDKMLLGYLVVSFYSPFLSIRFNIPNHVTTRIIKQ